MLSFFFNTVTAGIIKPVCPVSHSGEQNVEAPVAEKVVEQDVEAPVAEKKVCPVAHDKVPKKSVCPVATGGGHSSSFLSHMNHEPADEPERRRKLTTQIQHSRPEYANPDSPDFDPDEIVPAHRIPATGRGNSEDGKEWLNPSGGQLFRALKRKNKPIEKEEGLEVAVVHQFVTRSTWNAILEYENLHMEQCPTPKLHSFVGKDGIFSPKAKLMSWFGVVPFDRHDWVVDRCGKEVRYIIDYYSQEDEDDLIYSIDARPDLFTIGGFSDRARVLWRRLLAGESLM
jgi:cytochrome c heme-lyase